MLNNERNITRNGTDFRTTVFRVDTAIRTGRSAFLNIGTQLNFVLKIGQISLLFKMSQRLYDWIILCKKFC